jgi:hypothetical protein
MKYTHEMADEVSALARDFLLDVKKNKYKQISFEIDGGFASPPVLEICRCMDAQLPFEAQELLTRYCVMGKAVTVLLDDEPIETFIMNDLTTKWDVFSVFEKYPMALQILIEVCVAHVSKKYMLPSRDTQTKEATKA